MKATGKTEQFVYQAVQSGAIEIREDGTVWRVIEERGNKWNSELKRVPVSPRRLDLTTSNGYRMVKIMRQRKQVTTLAHRLVWLHIHGPIPKGLTINHKNGIRGDNRPENLELATLSEQQRHSIDVLKTSRTLRQNGEANTAAKLTENDIREIRRLRRQGLLLRVIGAKFNVSFQAISKIVKRKRWAHVD